MEKTNIYKEEYILIIKNWIIAYLNNTKGQFDPQSLKKHAMWKLNGVRFFFYMKVKSWKHNGTGKGFQVSK